VGKTGNGRMSEAQAAVALFNLDHYAEHQQRNERMFARFRTELAGIPGLEVRVPHGVSHSNYQNLICLIDEAAIGVRRDDLLRILRAENLVAGRGFEPALHDGLVASSASRASSLAHAGHYSARTIELPMNQALAERDVARLVDRLALVQRNAAVIRQRLAEAA
jgi:dTDP-4-amino-4,6-dideoxygalactose transaminase